MPKLASYPSPMVARPVFDNYIFHTNLNINYSSAYNYDLNLSEYRKVPA